MSHTTEGIATIPKTSREYLNTKQIEHYKNWRKRFIRWLTHEGKNVKKAEGYAPDTAKRTAYRTDVFMRFVWSEKDGYTLQIEPSDAEQFIEEELIYSDDDYSNGHKDNTQKAIQRLFKWLDHTGEGETWEPNRSFSSNSISSGPREFLTKQERQQIREAALEYSSIPGYNDLSPEDRDKSKAHLAQRFGKSKSEIVPQDWKKANGYKHVSLAWVSLDAGLRPIEVDEQVSHGLT